MAQIKKLGDNYTEDEMSDCLKSIRHASKKWNLNQRSLMEQLGRLLVAQNTDRAIKLIKAVPKRRFGLFR